MRKKSLLWVGDAGCPSGFARATHAILEGVRRSFEVAVLAINYRGDYVPGEWKYPMFPAAPGGDPLGLGRIIWACDRVKPDVIVLQNDPWLVELFLRRLARVPEYAKVPVIGVLAVDGLNCDAAQFNALSGAIFWTEFGAREAKQGGWDKLTAVVPLGVDTSVFRPKDKLECRSRLVPAEFDGKFIIGSVNRNQHRKRWDLLIQYFARWVHQYKIKDAALMLHAAPTGDEDGFNVAKLAKYWGVRDRIILSTPQAFEAVSDDAMCDMYNCFDISATTTMAEGFGLTALEAMACGVPLVAPDHSAIGEWAKGAAWLVKSPVQQALPPTGWVIGAIPDERDFIGALNHLYNYRDALRQNGVAALERARERRFAWHQVAENFTVVIEEMVKTFDTGAESDAVDAELQAR